MTTQETFGHNIKALAVHLKNVELELKSIEESFLKVKESIQFVRKVIDEIHEKVINHLPKGDENDSKRVHRPLEKEG